jgi:hypothetical protein
VAARASSTERSPDLRIIRVSATGNQSSRSGVRLYDAGLHNRSRNRARNWVHSRIWRSRDYFLSTPPTRKTAIVPFLRLSLSDGTSYGSPARTEWPIALGRLRRCSQLRRGLTETPIAAAKFFRVHPIEPALSRIDLTSRSPGSETRTKPGRLTFRSSIIQ